MVTLIPLYRSDRCHSSRQPARVLVWVGKSTLTAWLSSSSCILRRWERAVPTPGTHPIPCGGACHSSPVCQSSRCVWLFTNLQELISSFSGSFQRSDVTVMVSAVTSQELASFTPQSHFPSPPNQLLFTSTLQTGHPGGKILPSGQTQRMMNYRSHRLPWVLLEN